MYMYIKGLSELLQNYLFHLQLFYVYPVILWGGWQISQKKPPCLKLQVSLYINQTHSREYCPVQSEQSYYSFENVICFSLSACFFFISV